MRREPSMYQAVFAEPAAAVLRASAIRREAASGEIDAQRVMERLHAKYASALETNEALKADAEADRAAAKVAAEQMRAVIDQKDRARAIAMRIGSNDAPRQPRRVSFFA